MRSPDVYHSTELFAIVVVVVFVVFFFFADGLFVDSDDGLPEPPAFLRDIVYPPDGRDPRYDSDGRDPRYDSDGPAPYHPPPSPGRQRQVGSQDDVIPQFFGHRNDNEILS